MSYASTTRANDRSTTCCASDAIVTLGGVTVTLGGNDYVGCGMQHIVLSVDHLLSCWALLLTIVSDRWTLVDDHVFHPHPRRHARDRDARLAGAPLQPLEPRITLSIFFLGRIVRTWRGETSFTIRHPWVVAFAFGLLHGFGFASGLTAMGLPKAEIPLALLLFNVGVEIGQVAFVLLVILLERSFRVLEVRWPRLVEHLPGYAVGTLGAYWTIQRTLILLAGAR